MHKFVDHGCEKFPRSLIPRLHYIRPYSRSTRSLRRIVPGANATSCDTLLRHLCRFFGESSIRFRHRVRQPWALSGLPQHGGSRSPAGPDESRATASVRRPSLALAEQSTNDVQYHRGKSAGVAHGASLLLFLSVPA